MSKDIGALSAREVIFSMKVEDVTVAQYADNIAEQVDAHQNINAIQWFDPDHLADAMTKAVHDAPDSILAGFPIVAKDNINTTNFPTSGGTGALLGHTPDTNATVVNQIIAAGGVIGAKSGMHELAFGITSNNAVTGAIRNPHDPDLIAGGSSGGTAAAIAAGIFRLGLGTDTGGSCRIPASLCGTVGYRPSTGRYAGDGVIPISHTLDTVGSFGGSVDDVALLDEVLTGRQKTEREDLLGVRIGIPQKRFFDDLDDSIEQAISRALKMFERAGATLVDVSFDDYWPHAEAFSFPVALYEVVRDLPAYLAKHAPRVTFEDLVAQVGSPDVKGILSSQIGADAIAEADYNEALKIHRPVMRAIYAKVFADHRLDVLAFPTTPLTARPIGQDETVELRGQRVPTFPTYTRNTDLAPGVGAPAISLPCPHAVGLPAGVALDGIPGQDEALLALAQAAENAMKRYVA